MREVVDSEAAFGRAVSDYEAMGWEVVDRSEDRAVVERGLRGSWWWHLLFLVLIPIAANLSYSAFRRYNRPARVVIRLRDSGAEPESDWFESSESESSEPEPVEQ